MSVKHQQSPTTVCPPGNLHRTYLVLLKPAGHKYCLEWKRGRSHTISPRSRMVVPLTVIGNTGLPASSLATGLRAR